MAENQTGITCIWTVITKDTGNRQGKSMKVGKIPENVLKRSVLKQIKTTREEVLIGAGVGEDCAILALKDDEVFVVSTDPITGSSQ